MKERYVDVFTDFGFKKIFGEESSKDILKDFLGELLPEKGKIKKIKFLKTEHLGNAQADRKAIFDLYCENEKGDKFIVELQKAKQKFFKDRSLYYATFALQEQAIKGEWDFKLNPVYTISIMDFVFDDTETDFITNVQLMNTKKCTIFNDTLRFIYIEMPKFTKKEKELTTRLDKWMFVLKNLYLLDDVPTKIKEKVFLKLFGKAEIASYTPQQQMAYQDSLKYARDYKNVIDTAVEESAEKFIKQGIKQGIEQGIEKGIEIGRMENKNAIISIAVMLKNKGESIIEISKITGLSENEIIKL